MARSRVLLGALAVLAAPSLQAGSIEVQVELPQESRIDLEKEGYQTLLVAPFLAVETKTRGDYAYEKEAARYFERIFARDTKLKVVEGGSDPLPFSNVDAMAKDAGFWQRMAAEHGVDLLLTGQVTYTTTNRSGYVQNTYQSAVTGRQYADRPTFVYRSGVTLVMDVVMVEGKTGDVLYRDRFMKDRTVDGSGGDPLQNFFDLLRGLQKSVLGIVTPQKMVATRYILD
jgi:hypothetical protein